VTDELVPLGWSDDVLPLHTHVCFYYSDPETMKRSLAFLEVGLDEPGDFCAFLADERRHASLLGLLRQEHGRDLGTLLETGKLAAIEIGGAGAAHEAQAPVDARLDRALSDGYGRMRLLAVLSWGQSGRPETRTLKRFEAAVSRIVARYPAVVVCSYAVPHLAGEMLRECHLDNRPAVVREERASMDDPLSV